MSDLPTFGKQMGYKGWPASDDDSGDTGAPVRRGALMSGWLDATIYTVVFVGLWIVVATLTGIQPGWGALVTTALLAYASGHATGRRAR